MKKLTQILLSAGALFVAAAFAHAQPAPKVAVVDMEKVFNNHYETLAMKAKLQAAAQKAQATYDEMRKELQDLVDQYKALAEQANNPAATADAKQQATQNAQHKGQDVQQKQADIQKFAQDAQNEMRQEFANFRNMLVDQISKIAVRIAKDQGATLVLDKTAPSIAGTQLVIYSDPSYDITDQVMAEINKNKPADMPSAPSATPDLTAPSGSSESSSSSAPQITVPNVTPSH